MSTNTKSISAPPGLGLCLTGGGITGPMYEVGVLAAIEDCFEDFRACDFSVFVGVGSGSVLASALAGGLSAQRLYRALLDPADDFFPLQRQHILRFDGREIRRVSRSLVGAARRVVASFTTQPLDIDVWNELERFLDSLPAGLFTVDAFRRFLKEIMQRRGIPKNFDAFERPLRIIANDIDRGERIIFGEPDTKAFAVSDAVAAACAVPLLYAPVRIGERDIVAAGAGKAGHVDVAVDAGSDAVVVINPVVPIATNVGAKTVPTGHGKRRRIRDKGLLWVYNQSWRLVTEAHMQDGLAEYRASHPQVEIVLVEPDRSAAKMFMYSPMNFTARRTILEDAYTTTVKELRQPESPLRKMLESKGLKATPI